MLTNEHSTREALQALSYDESDPNALDRRRFLQLVGLGVGAGALAGGPAQMVERLLVGGERPAWAAGPVGPNEGVLVIIGMIGGNDGLNTVVPFNDGNYYQQHGGLAVPGGQTLPIAADAGLHSNLTEFKRFWDMGQLAVVQGIGYPGQDLSHFSSLANWMGGSVGGVPTTGWIGRWLDGLLGGSSNLFAAAVVGNTVPLHLVGAQHRGTAVPPRRPLFGPGTDSIELRMQDAVRSMRTTAEGQWHGSIATALNDQIDVAKTLAPVIPEGLDETAITTQLEVAARLINANLGFRVLTAQWGDFDSHAGQPKMHAARMADLNAAVRRFFQVLDPAWASRVTVMTFSEFGRTSWANDGQGTDHGSSAPQFVIGRNVRGGLYGLNPNLAGVGRWDRMAHQVDFRSYYASILDGWLGGGSSTVLGGTFEDLDLFTASPGAAPGSTGSLPPAVVSPPASFVPLTPFRIVDTRDGTGNVVRRPLAAGERIRVPIAGVGPIPDNGVIAVVANVTSVDHTSPTFMTVYPGTTARPETSNLNALPGPPVPNLVVMGVGNDRRIEIYNAFGTAHCLVDVYGYFASGAGDRFVPLSPARLFDSRSGLGVRPGKLGSGERVDIQVTGAVGVPASGVSAVVVNLTVTEPESSGWMRVTPTGQAGGLTSNVNFATGNVAPNLAICKVGNGGKISVDGYGTAHVIGDVFGYFGSSGGRLRALPPDRILDTREGLGAPQAPVGPGSTVALTIRGQAQVPSNATAVVLNLTATNVAAPSYVVVWPSDQPQPETSNLNVMGGQTAAKLVICRIGADGKVLVNNPIAACDVIADALGYFIDA